MIKLCGSLNDVDDFAEDLRNQGWPVVVEHAPFNIGQLIKHSDLQGISVGCSVPIGFAVNAIKMSRAQYPQLQYVHLSSDRNDGYNPTEVHYVVYIGLETHLTTRLHCREWSAEDFEALDPEMKSYEFHAFVRSKHPHPLDIAPKQIVTFRGGSQDGLSIACVFDPRIMSPHKVTTSSGAIEIYDLKQEGSNWFFDLRK